MSRSQRTLLLILVCLALAATSAFGQAINATLTGIVSDASGAVVPKANITLTNVASGDQRKSVTNDSGYFSLVAVPSGEYTITVDAPGFQKFERRGLTFTGADHRTMNDIVLQVGTATESVSVSAAVVDVVPVDSGEKSTVLTSKQLQDFSVVGRSAAEFLKIMPGFAIRNGVQNRPNFSGEVMGINGNGDAGSQSALNDAYSAQGAPRNNIDITADGAHVSDPGCNCATPVNPNTDMIQEFKVMTNAFSAENSKGPIVINTVAKSGTRDFHGEAYFYARHYAMNANDWSFNNSGLDKAKNKYLFPGGNVSGPVILPGTNFNRNRDKLFFFSGFEYYYQTLDSGLLQSTVPTEAMRSGNFSPAEVAKLGANTRSGAPPGQITDTTTCPGGMCPQSAWFPGMDKMLKLYPLPNATPTAGNNWSNYVSALDFNQNSWQSMSRIDYSISDNTKLFVRANLQNELQGFPVSLWWRPGGSNSVPYPTPIDGKNTSKSVSSSLTHVFSPSLTNEVVFGYTFIDFPNIFQDKTKVDRTAVGLDFPGVFRNGISQIPSMFNNYNGSHSEVATMWNPGGFEAGHGNLYATKHMLNVADNVSKVIRTHTLKIGVFSEYLINNQPANNFTNGQLSADWQNTGSSGNSYADLLLGRLSNYQESNLNPLHNEAYRTYEFYVQDSWKVVPRLTLDLGVRFQHIGNWYDREGIGFAVWDPASWSANIHDATLPNGYPGVKWYARDKNIPNPGFDSRALFFAPRFGMAWDIFGTGKTVIRGGWGQFRFNTAQSTAGMDVGWGVVGYGSPSYITMTQLLTVVPPTPTITGVDLVDRSDSQKPLTTNYNFTISQRLPGATLLEVGYVGSHSEHLGDAGSAQGGLAYNINTVPFGRLLGITPGFNYDDYRPYPNYQGINILKFIGYSNYNSLQTTVTRQSGRWNYQFNYTWSKTLGINNSNGNYNDPFNINNNYGISPVDRTHVFNAAYSVELPDAVKNNRLLGGLVNGWQISGITQIQSGADLVSNSPNGNFNLSINGDIQRQYYLGTGDMRIMPVLTCDPAKGLSSHQYVNGNCFAMPAPGSNGPIRIPAIRGPAFFNSDLSLFKNFKISESKKVQFRASGYNFLNHPITSFTAGSELNLNSAQNSSTDPLYHVVVPSSFGYTYSKYGHRVMQLALKFYF